ncbi:hypothetical protein BDN72DRAFT_340348 [Pluteus cervinus]|uniref:Uncharacterized protein n=1 Tax=Pluteus cervinus TaxID=181527 RepID=A0ACD3ABN4_9AGAR|nr:hypothetical protein BDN72DRAFT_340348 [Pluteus cervinus]
MRPSSKTAQYETVTTKGDILVNSVQPLSEVYIKRFDGLTHRCDCIILLHRHPLYHSFSTPLPRWIRYRLSGWDTPFQGSTFKRSLHTSSCPTTIRQTLTFSLFDT